MQLTGSRLQCARGWRDGAERATPLTKGHLRSTKIFNLRHEFWSRLGTFQSTEKLCQTWYICMCFWTKWINKQSHRQWAHCSNSIVSTKPLFGWSLTLFPFVLYTWLFPDSHSFKRLYFCLRLIVDIIVLTYIHLSWNYSMLYNAGCSVALYGVSSK